MVSMKTKTALVADIDGLIGAVADKMRADGDRDDERDFMAERCPPRLQSSVRTLPTLSMHLLAAIAEGPVSIVGLAARSGQLKGTVSKHVQRLVTAGLAVRSPIPGNRKEIQLNLTEDGELVAEVHARLHDEMSHGMRDFLARYTHAELEVLAKMLTDLLATRKEGVRLVP
jgi:DNA-binding MarR family transcriptional regulator